MSNGREVCAYSEFSPLGIFADAKPKKGALL